MSVELFSTKEGSIMFDLLELQQLMIHETSPEYRKQFAVVDT